MKLGSSNERLEELPESSIQPTLCVIGGLPRGGTRNFADLANAHPAVSLFGELQGRAVPAVESAMEGLEVVHAAGNARGLDRFRARKQHIALSLLALHSKNPRPYFVNHDYESGVVGFKTPSIEKEFNRIDILTEGFKERRVFFYCCRNLDQNYLSLSALGWRKSTEHYFREVRNSLINALKIHRVSTKGGGWKFRALHLDDYAGSTDKPKWLIDNLYGQLGIGADLYQVRQYVEQTKNRNATAQKTGAERRKTLTPAEYNEFQNAQEIRELLDVVNQEWGTSIRMMGRI